MSTKTDDGKRKWHPLGRHAVEDVPNALVELIAKEYPGRVSADGSSIRTLDALLEAWAAWVETRQDLSPHTVQSYLGFARRVLPSVRSMALESMSRDRYRQIRESLEQGGMRGRA